MDVRDLVRGDKLTWKSGEVVTFCQLNETTSGNYTIFIIDESGKVDYWNCTLDGKFCGYHDDVRTIVGVNGKLLDSVDKDVLIAKLQAEIKLLKKAPDLSWPQENDEYFYVDEQGEIGSTHFCEGHGGDDWNKLIGNCYKTREEAARQTYLLRLAAEIKRKSFQPDWDNHDQPKHYAYFDHDDDCVDYGSNMYLEEVKTYFETEEKVQEAFKDVCKADFLDMKRKGLI